MARKTEDTELRKATRAEELYILKERDARRKDPIAKREADIDNIVDSYEIERANQVYLETDITTLLDEKQKNIVTELDDAADLRRDFFENIDADDTESLEHFEAANATYEKAIVKAIRAGLFRHPLVRKRISLQCNFGERDPLRDYSKRLGLDTGVARPMKKLHVWLALHASPLAADGKKPEAIRRILLNSLLKPEPVPWLDLTRDELKAYRSYLRGMSRQAFYKRLRRLQVIDVPD